MRSLLSLFASSSSSHNHNNTTNNTTSNTTNNTTTTTNNNNNNIITSSPQRPSSIVAQARARTAARSKAATTTPSTSTATATATTSPVLRRLQHQRRPLSAPVLSSTTSSKPATTTTTTTPTTTTAPKSHLSSRPPRSSSLRTGLRHDHAPPLASPLNPTRASNSISNAANMPGGERARPQQPQLSTAPAKSINRAPLTPKVATPTSTPSKGPFAQVVTPLGRRTQNQTASIPLNLQTQNEDVASPVASFLASNITPRSGKRQIRVESVNTTPSGTPVPERTSPSWENVNVNNINNSNNSSNINLANTATIANNNPRGGLGATSALAYDVARQPAPLDNPPAEPTTDANKFFYASDAKSLPQVAPQRPASVPQKPTSFFYANGTSADSKRTSTPPVNPPFTPVLSSTQEPAATKFFYANGTPDVLARPAIPVSSSASTVSSSSRMAPARPGTSSSASGLGLSMPQRPLSPIKMMSAQSAYTLKTSPMPMRPASPVRPTISPPPILAPAPTTAPKRRVSIEAPPKPSRGHSRTGSVITADPVTPRLSGASQGSSSSASPPRSPGLSQPAMTMATILQAAEDLAEDEEARGGDSRSDVHSPTKSARFTDPVSDHVANARRERKVQDLEITNASLEAINRTLERQLRKQTAELRRYKRLSRSGRLSLTSGASSRVTSAAFSEAPTDLSDLSEEDGTEEEEEDLDSLDESDFSDTEAGSIADILSPNSKLTSRRQRDERRLELDLSKHQELLIDSQKINQSLKRCLDWTEVLIKEGQKALDYHVRVSDVELGGRVLAPPDEDDDEGEVSHLEDEGDETVTSGGMGLEPPWVKGPQDRDSGIELPPEAG